MEEIKRWVLSIATAAVLVVILDLLIPESRIRKFTRLLTGFVIMFIIINPAAKLIGNGGKGLAGNLDEYFFSGSRLDRITDAGRSEQARQTLELYREILLSDIHNRLNMHKEIEKAEVDIVLNENINSEKYGQIRKIYINLILSEAGEREKKMFPGANDKIASEISKELQKTFLLDEKDILINMSEN
ncbi:MAG TPA: stage III sporulation protein AF [Ruminiclostridium sp.]|jgi:stage III sporulation protein AF|nr:stage III sporulation protein AF [Clostridiaceae bacterium]HAA25156.1 stage III sporulation protein AF [Ruminiclostridium sp.]